MDDALKLIITKSPAARQSAMATLRAAGRQSPMTQDRYQSTVNQAFDDRDLFTDDEWEMIVSHLEATIPTGKREKLIQIRVYDHERDELERRAHEAGFNGNVSAWTRSLWGID